MKREKNLMNVVILVIALCMAGAACADPMGTAFTYQGGLNQAGEPVNGPHDFEFELYDDPNVILGNQVGSTVTIEDANLIDGSFAVKVDFGPGIFTGDASWLEMAVRPGASSDPCDFVTLSPRQEMTPTPYAMHSGNADTLDDLDSADFASSGHDHDSVYALISHIHDDRYYTETQLQSSGSSSVHWDNLTSVPAGLGDGDDNTQLTEGQVDTYVANNGYLDGASALDWDNITIDMPAGFADGVDDVGGGDSDWTISGSDMYTGAGVTGNVGIGTTTPAAKLTVNGAILRQGSMMYGSNAHTHINLGTSSTTGTDGSGQYYCTVGGGADNTASNCYAAVGGGQYNTASDWYATVAGGNANTASGEAATVAGGDINNAGGFYATVGGGNANTASGEWATIGGGMLNTASGWRSTVGGGKDNSASGNYYATVGGGVNNTASGWTGATVPGGRLNVAGGSYSFAAGQRAKVRDPAASGDSDGDEGTFVWADSTEADFTSTGPDQFLIRASGGVGIGTNDPNGALDVNGAIYQRGIMLHADYVFETDYQLESIAEHAEFMYTNKHLKAIPKAKVDESGREIVEVGSHRKGIVEELEKAHIYIEQLHNRINELKSRDDQIQSRLTAMEATVSKLINSNDGGQL